jgi:hypothetical protein
VRYSRHARQRLSERHITEENVEEVVSHHEVSWRDPKDNLCYVRTIDGRRIKVVLAQADPEFVITVIDLDA